VESQRLDVAALRARFPALASGTAYFDGPGGTQTPDVVADAVRDTLVGPLSNQGDVTASERNAEAAVRRAREAMRDFVGLDDPSGVVFGRSMTALTFQFAQTIAKSWEPGDEVVVSRLDHDANVRPWVIAAERVGATTRWADFDPATGELSVEAVEAVVGPRTRLVALTAASNLIGTKPDVAAIGEVAHRLGAWLYVDAVHFAAHSLVDVDAMGADFLACSPYKFLGPHCGVVVARPDVLALLEPDKLLPATDAVPQRFELGTLPYELLAGVTAAVDFLAGIAPSAAPTRRDRLAASMAALAEHEDELRAVVERGIAELPGATIYSRAARRTPTILATFDAANPQHVYRALAERGVNAPADSFYAYEPARRLGLGAAGGVRMGIAPYTDMNDVDRLLDGLKAIVTA
jgi:cysteine desulfurase family protein (TIGR01976 family)